MTLWVLKCSYITGFLIEIQMKSHANIVVKQVNHFNTFVLWESVVVVVVVVVVFLQSPQLEEFNLPFMAGQALCLTSQLWDVSKKSQKGIQMHRAIQVIPHQSILIQLLEVHYCAFWKALFLATIPDVCEMPNLQLASLIWCFLSIYVLFEGLFKSIHN